MTAYSDGQMNRHGCKPTAEQDWRVPSGPTWLAGPTSTNLPAVDGCPPGRDRVQVRRHEIASTLTGRRSAAVLGRVVGRLAPCLSFCPFTPVRDRSPMFTQIMFAQFPDGGGRR